MTRFTPHHKKRKYAAFYRLRGTRNWKRIHPDIAGSKASIVRTYQNWLLAEGFGPMSVERAVRAVRRKKTS